MDERLSGESKVCAKFALTACQVRVPLVKVLIFSSPTSHRRVNSRIDFARFPWLEKLCGTKFVQGPVYMEVGDPR